MRVVAGTARGLKLRGPSSPGTRPISDRAKEALFN
ncbi:MAG TPA: RsmD family RNA methyltransferase, partial [Acidimicrobiales bacterium]|nr:RsmD family RNA methyltransferase [Acidimicrobiales bacterium]